MRILLVSVTAVLTLAAGVRWQGARSVTSALFAFDAGAAGSTPAEVAAALGGPLTAEDVTTIERIARAEVEQAFSGLRIRLTGEGRAFWRVWVVSSVIAPDPRGRPRRNAAGAAYAFGMLGGGAFVNFNTLASKAVSYAPAGAVRQDIVNAIGRGIGRSAVHELAHLVAGSAPIHSDDPASYEYHHVNRASQYYGEISWSSARPLLERKLGARR